MKRSRGAILFLVIIYTLVLSLAGSAIVYLNANEEVMANREMGRTRAFYLAEAGLNRGVWQLRSSLKNWLDAKGGAVISGYNFDSRYTDVPGGKYRIKFEALGNNRVAVISEGRDDTSRQVRAVRAVFYYQAVPGPLISRNDIDWRASLSPHWGPVVSLKNIRLNDSVALSHHYPRKFAGGVVVGRDGNGLTAPNTDGTEWWSGSDVADTMSELDFEKLRATAKQSHTLNVYGCRGSGTYSYGEMNDRHYVGRWDMRTKCCEMRWGPGNPHPLLGHPQHFGNSYNHPDSQKNLVWYWDGNVELIGDVTYYSEILAGKTRRGTGLRGTIIVRGTLVLDSDDCIPYYSARVPSQAWREYMAIDTSRINQYPADNGRYTNRTSFGIGTENWTSSPLEYARYGDVGIRGFIYCDRLVLRCTTDIHGAVWVNSGMDTRAGLEQSLIYYDDTLVVPTRTIRLRRESWSEYFTYSTRSWS